MALIVLVDMLAAHLAFYTACNHFGSMSHQPSHQWMPCWHTIPKLILEPWAMCPEHALDDLHTNLGIPICLRVVLRGVLAHQFLQSLNPQLPQRLDKQLQDRRLVVGLKYRLGVPEPFGIPDNRIHRERLLVDAFLRDHMPEDSLALAVPR